MPIQPQHAFVFVVLEIADAFLVCSWYSRTINEEVYPICGLWTHIWSTERARDSVYEADIVNCNALLLTALNVNIVDERYCSDERTDVIGITVSGLRGSVSFPCQVCLHPLWIPYGFQRAISKSVYRNINSSSPIVATKHQCYTFVSDRGTELCTRVKISYGQKNMLLSVYNISKLKDFRHRQRTTPG